MIEHRWEILRIGISAKYNQIAKITGIPGGQGHSFYEQWRGLDRSSLAAQDIAATSRAYYNSIREAVNGRK